MDEWLAGQFKEQAERNAALARKVETRSVIALCLACFSLGFAVSNLFRLLLTK